MTTTQQGELVAPTMTAQKRRRRETMTAYLFLSPTLIGFVLFLLGPIMAAIVLTFFDWNLLTPAKFAGLDNYVRLFSDPRMGIVYGATAKIAAIVIVADIGLGLGIAVLLDHKMPNLFRHFFRLSYFFPVVVSASAVALIWSFLMNRDLGMINYYLGLLGIENIPWLNSSAWSPISIAIITVWQHLGFNIIVFLGGLQAIPNDLYEAASVDGANGWTKFRHITLPLLTPTLLLLTVIDLINASQIFAQSYVLTRGGPGDSSRTVVMYIYEQGFQFRDIGYASTIALSLFIIILIITVFQFRLSRRWVFYQ